MDSFEVALEMLGQRIQQQERQEEKRKKLQEQQKKDQVSLEKLMKEGKVVNPLLLIFFLEMQGMKTLSQSAKPLIDRNDALHNEYLAKLKQISELNQKLQKLVSSPDYNESDQVQAMKLQNQIAKAQVDAQQIQQKEQNLWAINFQPTEINMQSTSNMAASSLELLNQSRMQFLSTTK